MNENLHLPLSRNSDEWNNENNENSRKSTSEITEIINANMNRQRWQVDIYKKAPKVRYAVVMKSTQTSVTNIPIPMAS